MKTLTTNLTRLCSKDVTLLMNSRNGLMSIINGELKLHKGVYSVKSKHFTPRDVSIVDTSEKVIILVDKEKS